MAKPYIGIKNIWYGPVIAEVPTKAKLTAMIGPSGSFTRVKNSHDGTWSYEQDDPETTDYKNELTGLTYFTDKTSDGNHTINFTMGVYDYAQKADLQGGLEVKSSESATKTTDFDGWQSASANDLVNKCVIAQTKTGHLIVFTNALIIAKVDTQEKNLGLGVKATAQENGATGVAAEYWVDADSAKDILSGITPLNAPDETEQKSVK
jgi:hypothetical protein